MQENSNLISRQEGNQNAVYNINWESLLWMLFGWLINWEFSWGIGTSIDELIRDLIEVSYNISFDDPYSNFFRSTIFAGLFIGGLIGGAGVGTSIAWILRKENVIRKKASYLLLVIGWSVGSGIGLLFYEVIDITIGGSLCGLIGGITMVLVFQKEKILNDKFSIILIFLGWTLGSTIGWGINSFKFGSVVQFASMWLAAGVMMSWILSPLIKTENQNRSFPWIVFGWSIGGVICYFEIERGINYIASIIIDDVGGLMMGMFYFLRGLGMGTLAGLIITVLVVIREKPLNYEQVFLRIVLGLISIGFTTFVVLWISSEIRIRLTYFAINSVISGVIGWGIMLWVLRKKEIQR
jgi:hypothetical protein